MMNNLFFAKNLLSIFSDFNAKNFVSNLKYMLSGMIAIFIVIGVIILITYALNRVVNYVAFAREEKKKFQEFKDSENN